MEPRHVSALSDEDKLSLWVGRMAREHARLEYGLSNVRSMLDGLEEGVAPSRVVGVSWSMSKAAEQVRFDG